VSLVIHYSAIEEIAGTIVTSSFAFLAVLPPRRFGREIINGFAFAMVVGIIIETYSSILYRESIVFA
jgi:preprotein translocase subunit SecF